MSLAEEPGRQFRVSLWKSESSLDVLQSQGMKHQLLTRFSELTETSTMRKAMGAHVPGDWNCQFYQHPLNR